MSESNGAVEQFEVFARRMSPFSRGVCGVLVLFYLLSFSSTLYGLLTLTPVNVLPPSFFIWTLVTAGFLETRFYNVIVDLFAMAAMSSFVEPVWGWKEFLRYLLLVDVATNLACAVFVVIRYAITSQEDYLFRSYDGMYGIVAGFAVILRQLLPEFKIMIFGVVPLRAKFAPLFMLIFSLSKSALGLAAFTNFPVTCFGLYVAWFYLRFYQKREGVRGDMSETFSFVSFFPEFIQPFLAPLATSAHNLSIKLKITPKLQYDSDGIIIGGVLKSSSSKSSRLVGTDVEDAERRKQRALKALDERLVVASSTGMSSTGEQSHSSALGMAGMETGAPANPAVSPRGAQGGQALGGTVVNIPDSNTEPPS
eukprot:Nk52_evm12s376 gene=Nk52_evmTU12s376